MEALRAGIADLLSALLAAPPPPPSPSSSRPAAAPTTAVPRGVRSAVEEALLRNTAYLDPSTRVVRDDVAAVVDKLRVTGRRRRAGGIRRGARRVLARGGDAGHRYLALLLALEQLHDVEAGEVTEAAGVGCDAGSDGSDADSDAAATAAGAWWAGTRTAADAEVAEAAAAGVEADVTLWRATWAVADDDDSECSASSGLDDGGDGARGDSWRSSDSDAAAPLPEGGGGGDDVSVLAGGHTAATGASQWRDLPPLLPGPLATPAPRPLDTSPPAAALPAVLASLFLTPAAEAAHSSQFTPAVDPLHAAVAAALAIDLSGRGPVSAVVGQRAAPPPPGSLHARMRAGAQWALDAAPCCSDDGCSAACAGAGAGSGAYALAAAAAATVRRLHGVEFLCRRVLADVAHEGSGTGSWPSVLVAALRLDLPVPPAPLWSPAAAALARALIAAISHLRHHVTGAGGAASSLLATREVLRDAAAAVDAFAALADTVFAAPLPPLPALGDAALVAAVDAAVGEALARASEAGDAPAGAPAGDGAEAVRCLAHAAAALALAPQVYSRRACDATLAALDAAAALGGRRGATRSGFPLAATLASCASDVWVAQLSALDAAMDPLWQYAHPAAAPVVSAAAVAGWAAVAAAAGTAAAADAADAHRGGRGSAGLSHAARSGPAALAALLQYDEPRGADADDDDAPSLAAQHLLAAAAAAAAHQRTVLAKPPEVPTLLSALVPAVLRGDAMPSSGDGGGGDGSDGDGAGDACADGDGDGGGCMPSARATGLHAVLDIRAMRLLSADGDGTRLPFARLLLPALPAAALLSRATGVAYEAVDLPAPDAPSSPAHPDPAAPASPRPASPGTDADAARDARTPVRAVPLPPGTPPRPIGAGSVDEAPHRGGAGTAAAVAAGAAAPAPPAPEPRATATAAKLVLGRGLLPLEGGRRSAWWDIDAQVDVKKKPAAGGPPASPAPAAAPPAPVVDLASMPAPVATTSALRRRHRRLRADAAGGGAGRGSRMAPILETSRDGDHDSDTADEDDESDGSASDGSRASGGVDSRTGGGGASGGSGGGSSTTSEGESAPVVSKAASGGTAGGAPDAAHPSSTRAREAANGSTPATPPAATTSLATVPTIAPTPDPPRHQSVVLPLPPPRAFDGGDMGLLEDLLLRAAHAALPRAAEEPAAATAAAAARYDTYATLGRSPSSTLAEGLARTLRGMHRAAAADATSVCIHEAGFVRHLWALRAVLLMERADALLPFFDALFTPLRHGGAAGGLGALRNSAAMTRWLRTSLAVAAGVARTPGGTPPLLQPSLFSVEFVGYDAPDAGSLLQRGVAVHYALPVVLEPLVGPSASGTYNRVFGMLLRLRRSLWELQHGMTEARRAGEVLAALRRRLPRNPTLAATAAALHRLHCAHACMLQFAVAVHSHMARAVVAEEWAPLLRACAAARHPDALAAAHARYLAAIERRCLLAPDQRPAAAALTTLATRMDTFAGEYASFYAGMRTACVAVAAAADAARAADAYLDAGGGRGGGGPQRRSSGTGGDPAAVVAATAAAAASAAAGADSVQRVAAAAFAGPTRIAAAAQAAARAFYTQLGLLLRAAAATPAASRRAGAATLGDVAALLDYNGFYSRLAAAGAAPRSAVSVLAAGT